LLHEPAPLEFEQPPEQDPLALLPLPSSQRMFAPPPPG
jgi:hypothetical protein